MAPKTDGAVVVVHTQYTHDGTLSKLRRLLGVGLGIAVVPSVSRLLSVCVSLLYLPLYLPPSLPLFSVCAPTIVERD